MMNGVLDRLIELVGACGTSSSIDSHKTYSFLKSAFDVLGRVQLILAKTNATPDPLNHPRLRCAAKRASRGMTELKVVH